MKLMRADVRKSSPRLLRGLKLYASRSAAGAGRRPTVLFSRRDGGPLYCWHYDEELNKWFVQRVLTNYSPKDLREQRSGLLPISLRTRLREHYSGSDDWYRISC